MKTVQNLRLRRGAIVLFLLCGTMIALFKIIAWPSGYFGFLKHNKQYYGEIAKACASLLSNTNCASSEWTIKGNDASLPTALRRLHATTIQAANHVRIGTNYLSGVSIIFGEGRPNFTVSWEQNDYGNGYRPWELTVNGDGGPYTVVYSTASPSPVQGTNSAN